MTIGKKNTVDHSDWKKLKNGPPDHVDLLCQAFGTTVVDGGSSCIPGEEAWEARGANVGIAGEDVGDTQAWADFSTPTSRSTHPLMRATSSTATSPKKLGKNAMVKVMARIQNVVETNCEIANKLMQGEIQKKEIHDVMELVVDCGVEER